MQSQAIISTTAQESVSLDIKSSLICGIMELTLEERKILLEMWKGRQARRASSTRFCSASSGTLL